MQEHDLDYSRDDEMPGEMRQGTGCLHSRHRKIQISFLQKLPLSRELGNSSFFQDFSETSKQSENTEEKKLQFLSRQGDQTV